MRVEAMITCLAAAALGASCSGSAPAPTLAVSPDGTVTVAGAQLFVATARNTQDPVTWTLDGPGSLSTSSGPQTTYRVPAALVAGATTATLTASVAGVSRAVSLQLQPAAGPTRSLPGLGAAVTVKHDAQGIPHVFCAALLDCLAAQGYLQARDRLFQMDLLRRTARGQLASLIGPLQLDSDKQFLTLFVTRDGRRLEDAMWDAADGQSREVLQAFARGVNAYLDELVAAPAQLPGEYAQLPTPITSAAAADIPRWTPQDTLALSRLQQFQLSSTLSAETAYGRFAQAYGLDQGRMNAWLRSREPVHSYTLRPTAARERRPVRKTALARAGAGAAGPMLAALGQRVEDTSALLRTLGLGSGSNNWVVDAAHSATGHAMVANDPHLSLPYPPLFHLMGLTASDGSGLDLTGGAFPGIPGALVGRGKHVGWGVTVVGYDVTDLYLEALTVDGQGRPAVQFKGAPVTLLTVPYTIKVRGGADVPYAVSVVPHHGPVVQLDSAHHAAVSFRWSGHDATNDLRGFLGLDLATAVGDITDGPDAGTAFAALRSYATGAQNFVLADDQGNIGYDPHALVPKRPWAGAAPDLLPWLPLPGDGRAEWGSGDAGDACATNPTRNCWVAEEDLPHGKNPDAGYFLTANSDPQGDTDDNDPIHNDRGPGSTYLSFEWDDVTGLRAARIGELLDRRLAAGGGKVSVDDLTAIQGDHGMKLAELMLPAIASVPDAGTDAAFQTGLTLLRAWGTATPAFDCPTGLTGLTPDSPASADPGVVASAGACTLFHAFIRTLIQNVFKDDLAVAGLGVSGGPALRAMLYMLEPGTPDADRAFCNDVGPTGATVATRTCLAQVQRALGDSVRALTQAFGPPGNWLWGRVHTLSPQSLAAPLVGPPFARGPFARPGGVETVDVGSPGLGSTDVRSFPYGSGANVRHVSVMDPAAPLTRMQLPGANRDVAAGVVAPAVDLLAQYVQNQYFTFAHGTQLDSTGGVVSVETFTP